jgi:hypothetical protein
VIAHDREADPVQGRLGGGELLKELDADARLLDHPPDAPNLAFDPIESRHEALLL